MDCSGETDAIELQEIDLNDVVRDTLRILDFEAQKRGVTLSVRHAEGTLPVRADQIQLQQVMSESCRERYGRNADLRSGDGRMSIQTALIDGSAIEVSVSDSGAGIPTDKLNEISIRLHDEAAGYRAGFMQCTHHRRDVWGKISAENGAEGGAVFRFTLPLSKGLVA